MYYDLIVPLSTKTVHVTFQSWHDPQEKISPYELKEAAKYAFGGMYVRVQATLAPNQKQISDSYRAISKPEWQQIVRENNEALRLVDFELNHVGTQLTVCSIDHEKKIAENDVRALDLEVQRDALTLQYKQVAERLHSHTALETLAERSKDFTNRLYVEFGE